MVEYLGRYSHKIAISNHRLRAISDQKVSFYYKDYKHGSVTKTMTLEVDEFLRRFCMHILPPKFVKMRHYGFLSNRGKEKLKIEQLKSGKIRTDKTKIDYKEITKLNLGFDIDACPCCKSGRMITILQFPANAPPIKTNNLSKKLKTNK